jgi:colanic acid/amylovoran biosynthesis glycosyltransferase
MSGDCDSASGPSIDTEVPEDLDDSPRFVLVAEGVSVLGEEPAQHARMILGYLVSMYPAQSHIFIRREIAAVEALGHSIRRYSIRRPGEVVDAVEMAEGGRTAVLLHAGPIRMAVAVGTALGRPLAFFEALRLAVRSGRRSQPGVLRHLAYLVEACLLASWCRRDGVQHLHAHFGNNPAAVAMLCRALGGPSYSFTAHGTEVLDAPQFSALDEKIARAAFTVAVSQFGRSQLCRWSDPAHWDRIHVVRCGVDRQFFDQPAVSVPETPRLVCVARLSREKGHVSLLQAVGRLHRAGRALELVLVGDGPMRPQLEVLIETLGIGSCVRFAGWQDGPGVIREIQAARALVLPSFTEGLPVVLMEAMALARPCIATQITGIPELVQAGVTGWLVPASCDEALAAAMAEVLDSSPAGLDRMGRAGAQRVAGLHDAALEAARIVALFAKATTGAEEGAPAPHAADLRSSATRRQGDPS